MLENIEIPEHVHAELCTFPSPHGGLAAVVVVWADRTSDRCGRCGETVGTETSCPAMCGQFGEAYEIESRHGCGEPLAPSWGSVDVAAEGFDALVLDAKERAEVQALVNETAEEYVKGIAKETEERRANALEELRETIADYNRAIAEGEDPEDARERLTTSEYEEHGTGWYNDRWEAWFTPADSCGGDTVIMTEDDLPITYTIRYEVADESGTTWQAVHPNETVVSARDPQTLVEEIAHERNVLDGYRGGRVSAVRESDGQNVASVIVKGRD